MAGSPFRFVHASDFHLDQPLAGLADVPEHLRSLLIEAPYRAAARVFDAVLAENADFLVLSGDLLAPQNCGPRAFAFLIEQFDRIATRNISVYWAAGPADLPEYWPAAIPLPRNVQMFSRGRVSELIHERDGRPLVRLLGRSFGRYKNLRAAAFEADGQPLYTIAVAHASLQADTPVARNVNYWALGGRHSATSFAVAPRVAHDPGTPQERHPREAGPHGCTLVHVDAAQQTRLSFIPTDVFRWQNQELQLGDQTTRHDLGRLLHKRTEAAINAAPGVNLFISWRLTGQGPLMMQLERGQDVGAILEELRNGFGSNSPIAWTVSIEVESAAALPASWSREDTILGDYLRALEQHASDDAPPLVLEHYLSEAHRAGLLNESARLNDLSARRRVLRRAAVLGASLLGSEDNAS